MEYEELWDQYVNEESRKKKKKTAREKKCPGVRGSEYHSASGKFTSKKKAASNSLWFSCKDLGRTRKGKKAISEPEDSGRGKFKDRGKGKYRIRDNKPLWERGDDGTMRVNRQSLELMVRQAMAAVLKRFDDLQEPERIVDSSKEKIHKVCRKAGYDSFANHLRKLNLIKRAEDGDLFEK